MSIDFWFVLTIVSGLWFNELWKKTNSHKILCACFLYYIKPITHKYSFPDHTFLQWTSKSNDTVARSTQHLYIKIFSI